MRWKRKFLARINIGGGLLNHYEEKRREVRAEVERRDDGWFSSAGEKVGLLPLFKEGNDACLYGF